MMLDNEAMLAARDVYESSECPACSFIRLTAAVKCPSS